MEMAAYEPVTRQSALNALSMMEHREVLDQALEIATRPVIPQPQSSEKLYDDDAVRIAAVRCISALGDANVAAKLLAGFTQTPPVSMRPAVAEAVTRLTGRPHRPVPEESFRPWSVESRKPPVFGPLPLAGVQEVNQTH
jgi:hypothetical protein